MYNEELKQEFLDWYCRDHSQSTRDKYVRTFNGVARHEEKAGADVCTFDVDAVTPILEEASGMRYRVINNRVDMLKSYAKWCLEHNVPGACDAMLKVEVSGSKLKIQTLSSPAHLEYYLNNMFLPASHQTHDNVYRCYYWLAYAGVDEAEAFKVTTDDIDFNNMLVRHKGMAYPIYREAVPAFRNCVELKEFVYEHPIVAMNEKKYRQRAAGNLLLRGEKPTVTMASMRVMLARIASGRRAEGKTDLRLSYYRVWLSGVFYRLYEQEQIGLEPQFERAARIRAQSKANGAEVSEANVYQLAYDFKLDYERWKDAYKRK